MCKAYLNESRKALEHKDNTLKGAGFGVLTKKNSACPSAKKSGELGEFQ